MGQIDRRIGLRWLRGNDGLFQIGSGIALAMTSFLNAGKFTTISLCGTIVAVSLLAAIRSDRQQPDWRISEGAMIGTATICAALLAYLVAAIWPNSGDEYGYVYLADTLLHGRFYNPPPPMPDLFNFFWIGMHDGKSASQYPPGWPAFLALFKAVRLQELANPVLVGILGLLLSASLKRLGVDRQIRLPLLALILLSPFTLFNGASLFSHMLPAVGLAGICLLQIEDDVGTKFWRRAAIGALLSLILATRHDSFLIVASAFSIDRLVIRRLAVFGDAFAYVLGALPISIIWLAYNWSVTGNPFLTTMLWAFPEEQPFGVRNILENFRNLVWSWNLLLVFAGGFTTLLYITALCIRLRRRSVRFYDFLLPISIIFFFFYLNDGGHEYGPRYWYSAWPSIALPIGLELSANKNLMSRLSRHANLYALATLQIYVFVGFTIVFALYLRLYIDQRRQLYAIPVPQTPAIVLVPNWQFKLFSWQIQPFDVWSRDLTRNGLDYDGPILYGRADQDRFVKQACSMRSYHVFLWNRPGGLEKVNCDAP